MINNPPQLECNELRKAEASLRRLVNVAAPHNAGQLTAPVIPGMCVSSAPALFFTFFYLLWWIFFFAQMNNIFFYILFSLMNEIFFFFCTDE